MKLTHLNPSELPDWSSLFSQVVIAEGSPLRVIAVSGQVGVDRNQTISGDGGFAAQLDVAFKNLIAALSAASCSVAEVVKLTIFVVGYSYEKAGVIRETLRRHFGSRPLPACSLIGVEALARPEFQVEVEALAIAEGCGSAFYDAPAVKPSDRS
jgi:enamine deaminase RidA (YjgF/YER057c/UK114 family)